MAKSSKLSMIEPPKIEKELPIDKIKICEILLDAMEESNHTMRLSLEQALSEVAKQSYKIERLRKELMKGIS